MRKFIVLSGTLLLLAAAGASLYYGVLFYFAIPVATITIVLGMLTSPPAGVKAGQDRPGSPRMIVDKGVLGGSIYQLVFFDAKLVLKRLVTSKTTILSFAILALAGFLVQELIGALAGVAVGYAIQEYTTQRNRTRILTRNSFETLGPGDLEFQYKDLKEVILYKNRLSLVEKNRRARISISKAYTPKLRPRLEQLFPGRFKTEDSVHSSDASRKQDK